jgi:tRNA(His) guanylyltransferase
VSKQKHEMLFSRFGINYNSLPERYRKGTVLVCEEVRLGHVRVIPSSMLNTLLLLQVAPSSSDNADLASVSKASEATENLGEKEKAEVHARKAKKAKIKTEIKLYHCDVIESAFWDARPYLLH